MCLKDQETGPPTSPARYLFASLFLSPTSFLYLYDLGIDALWIRLIIVHALYWAALTISITAYRLSPHHPLARYPGPLIARITRLWTLYKVLGGEQHAYFHHLHETYGDIVRTGMFFGALDL